MRYQLNFETEPFNASWHFDDELEVRKVKIDMDAIARHHIFVERMPRFPDLDDQAKITKWINRLLTMNAPPEAVGVYEWYVQVGDLRSGGGTARIVAVGHMLRSLLTASMRVRGTRYVIRGGELRKSGG